MHKRFGVVGASCTDVFATTAKPLIVHDSNPGTVRFGFGGVGRNIAENLARLAQTVQLFAAFGSDPFALSMLEHTKSAGVLTDGCLIAASGASPYYIAVNDPTGDMSVAVNDMAICNDITPDFIAGHLQTLNACDAVVLDTNIPASTVAFLAKECKAPLLADSVSVSKAEKLVGILPRLHALNTNLREARALLQCEITSDIHSLQHAANRFHALGIQWVLITLGAGGAFLSGQNEQIIQPAFPVKTANTNGCGDAFSAAAFAGILSGEDPETILLSALAAAAITATAVESVSGQLSPTAIKQYITNTRRLS